jgi:hypothetical protein
MLSPRPGLFRPEEALSKRGNEAYFDEEAQHSLDRCHLGDGIVQSNATGEEAASMERRDAESQRSETLRPGLYPYPARPGRMHV